MKYGVESLNQIARDMYRGPKGIDSFVQYMELGGEVALGEPLALLNVGYDSSTLREKILKETGVDINTIAEEEGVDPEIFARLIFKESGGNPNAEGDDGKAQGYLQLHAAAAEEVGVERSDPVQNLVGGARYLKKNLDRFGGDYEKALQAYNAGPTRVIEGNVPETTLAYASSILGAVPEGPRDDDLDGVKVASGEGVASLSGASAKQGREKLTPSGIGSIALGNLSEIFTQQETPRLKPSKITVRGPSGSRMAPPGMGTLPEMSMQGLDAFRELYQETTPYKMTPLKPSL